MANRSILCSMGDLYRVKQVDKAVRFHDLLQKLKCLVGWFIALRPSQQLWSGQNGQFTYLGKLGQAVNQYFVHILSFVTDNNPVEGKII